jgi:hypothetical protein
MMLINAELGLLNLYILYIVFCVIGLAPVYDNVKKTAECSANRSRLWRHSRGTRHRRIFFHPRLVSTACAAGVAILSQKPKRKSADRRADRQWQCS